MGVAVFLQASQTVSQTVYNLSVDVTQTAQIQEKL